MRVADLTGPLLDYWVAQAEGAIGNVDMMYMPSTDWATGGPIIDREGITVICEDGKWEAWSYWKTGKYEDDHEYGIRMEGETALIAAMRCLVANKFGVGAFKDELPESAN